MSQASDYLETNLLDHIVGKTSFTMPTAYLALIEALSVVNAAYKWTLSASGTTEYYLDLIGGGDPSIAQPVSLRMDGTTRTEATMGSLAAGEWDYGDNDTLGFSTVYVRLDDGADPDSKADDFVMINVPDDDQTGSTIVEVGYTSYARKSTAGADWNAAAAGNIDNANELAFPAATGGFAKATHFAICDAATVGNLLCYGVLTTPLTITSGVTPKFAPGDIDINLA